MQLHLEFFARDLCLPIAYRHYVQAMIYNALRNDPSYSETLHDLGNAMNGRQFKLFTFGQLEGSYLVRDRQIIFRDRVRLEIRSIHDDLMLRLFMAFFEGRSVRLAGCNLRVVRSSLENTHIDQSELTICTRSPIVTYVTANNGKTIFFTPEDEMFYSLIAANARRKWQSLHGMTTDFKFHITPAERGCFQKQVTQFKGTRITAWSGRFQLNGSCDVLNLLYHTGLGAKNSQGFGMFSRAVPGDSQTKNATVTMR